MADVRRYYDVNGWLFVGPALALIGLFMIYPIFRSLVAVIPIRQGHDVEIRRLRQHHSAVERSGISRRRSPTPLIFFVVQVPIMIMLALILAAVLNNAEAEIPRLLPHGDLPALRDFAGRLFRAVQEHVFVRWRGQLDA